jgi:serine/threonine protein kinase
MIGTKISHYHIAASLGAGGMGVVYLAEDERLHRKVALKFLPPAVAQDREARLRLRREAQTASALDHPDVATVYDIDEWNGKLFIAMPYYEGETLCTIRATTFPGQTSSANRSTGWTNISGYLNNGGEQNYRKQN